MNRLTHTLILCLSLWGLLFTSIPTAQGSMQALRIAIDNAGSYYSRWVSRTLGWQPDSPATHKALTTFASPNSHLFEGPTFAWMRSSLYKTAQKIFMPLAQHMTGITLPSWWRSPDTFAHEFHMAFDVRLRDDPTALPLKAEELVIQTNPKAAFPKNLPDDVQARLRTASKDKTSKPEGAGVSLADVIADLSGTHPAAVGDATIPPRTLDQVLEYLNTKAFHDLFTDKSGQLKDPLLSGPLGQLIERVRALGGRTDDQMMLAHEILQGLEAQEAALKQHLGSLYDRLTKSNEELLFLERAIKNLEAETDDHSLWVRQKHIDRRLKVSTEYMALINDLALFIRLRQYDMPLTRRYIQGVLAGTADFRTKATLSEAITAAVDTSLRSTEAAAPPGKSAHFAHSQLPSLPRRSIFMQDLRHPIRGIAERLGIGSRWYGRFRRRGLITRHLDGLSARYLAEDDSFWRRKIWHEDNTTLFPCLRDGTKLYYCNLSKPADMRISELLEKTKKKIDDLTPDQRGSPLAYEAIRDEIYNEARRDPDHMVDDDHILHGLFSLLDQMNPHSRAGHQLRNLLQPNRQEAQLIAARLADLRTQKLDLEIELNRLTGEKLEAKKVLATAVINPQEIQKSIDALQRQIDDLEKRLAVFPPELSMLDIENIALAYSQHRTLFFTPNGLPVISSALGKRWFALNDSRVFNLPVRIGSWLVGKTRALVGGGWVADALSDYSMFYRRTRRMLSGVTDPHQRDILLSHLKTTEERTTAVLRGSAEHGLSATQAKHLFNALFAADDETFLNLLEGWIERYGNLARNRTRLLKQRLQLETTYSRRLSDLDAFLAQSIRTPETRALDYTLTGGPRDVRDMTVRPSQVSAQTLVVLQDQVAARTVEQAQEAIADAYHLRDRLTALEKDLGISPRSSRDIHEAASPQRETFQHAATLYHHYYEKVQQLADTLAELESQRGTSFAEADLEHQIQDIRRKLESTGLALENVRAEMRRYLDELREFATRHDRLEVALADVEAAERDLSRLQFERDSLQARIAEAEPYRDSEDWDLVAALAENKRRLAALEPLIPKAQQVLDEAKKTFSSQYPEYNLETHLRRSTLARDLPGGTGVYWNQLNYEMLRRSGFTELAAREGGEVLAIAHELHRHGLTTDQRSFLRKCFAFRNRGRGMLYSGSIQRFRANWRVWTREFWTQFQDPFSDVHNQARLDYLQKATTLPSISEDLLDTLEQEQRAAPK